MWLDRRGCDCLNATLDFQDLRAIVDEKPNQEVGVGFLALHV